MMRTAAKRLLALAARDGPAVGATILTYHRVGGGSPDERDVDSRAFAAQLDVLERHAVVSIDAALARLEAGDGRPTIVLTFDDGFADVYDNAWPLLRDRRLPFTVYVASSFVGGIMHWEGSTASHPGAALTWAQLGEMRGTGLCTVGNHTHGHARPDALDADELDACNDAVEEHLGVTPRHFAYPWGIPVPECASVVAQRFRSAVTGEVGRNLPGCDPMQLRRVPVRRSDPIEFFAAKLTGRLLPERAYGLLVTGAKRLGARA